MPIWLGILVGVVALVAGVALGFFIARKYMMKKKKKNPPINEQMFPKENQSNDERDEQATNEISAKRHSLRVSFLFMIIEFKTFKNSVFLVN